MTAVYGFDLADKDRLAALISTTFGIPLRRFESPMIGRWYGGGGGGMSLQLEANNPEPGYTSPTHPGAGALILTVETDALAADDIDRRLAETGLAFRRISP